MAPVVSSMEKAPLVFPSTMEYVITLESLLSLPPWVAWTVTPIPAPTAWSSKMEIE